MTKGKQLITKGRAEQISHRDLNQDRYIGMGSIPFSYLMQKGRPRPEPFVYIADYTATGIEPEITTDKHWNNIVEDLQNLAREAREQESTIWDSLPTDKTLPPTMKEYMAHSAKGHSIFDSFAMIKGRNGLYSIEDLSPTLKQHFKTVVFRGVKYIDRNRGGNH